LSFVSFLSQISNFLLLCTVIHSQAASIDGAKSKRALYSYEDAVIGPPPPQPVSGYPHTYPSAPAGRTSGKWTNVFGFDDVTYQSIFNELNGFNYGIQTRFSPPPSTAPAVYNSNNNNNGFGYVNYGSPHDLDASYISHDGRILKQYSVHEIHHNDHPNPHTEFRPSPVVPTQSVPAQFPNYFVPQNVAQPRTLYAGGPRNTNQIPSFLNSNHGPIALGSGSLGFVTLPNGQPVLGSGSLGYISHSDHYNNIVAITNRRQTPQSRGPTTFGHSHF